jgi:ABC-type amino acid transport substrate-binding protein
MVNAAVSVGTGKGTTADLFVQDKMRRAKPVSISSGKDAVGALKRKKIDIYIADAPTIWWLAARHEAEGVKGLFEPLTREYLAWAVARQNQALLDAVNDVLARWKDDGSLDQSLSLWIP